MKKPTLDTLAAELGVSRQTISNALNKPHKVAPKTLERVRAEMERVGYRPSAAARALRTQQTYTLALRLSNEGDGINGAVMDGFLHALTTEAGRHGYRIALFTAVDDAAEIEVMREFRETKAVDGVILTDTHEDDARPGAIMELGLPVVAFGRPWSEDGAHSWVDVDGHAGTAEATRHLLAQGQSPVGYIGWPLDSSLGADRHAGWAEATGYSPKDAERYTERHEDSLAAGHQAMAALHARGVTAVVCASDSLALGAAAYLRENDIDGEVVGFDDTPVARMLGMSSLHQPVADVAKHAIDLLLTRIREPQAPAQHILLPPTLRLRTAAIPS